MSVGRTRPAPTGDRDGPASPDDPVAAAQRRWEAEVSGPALGRSPERKSQFHTLGGIPVARLYTPRSPRSEFDRIGYPGQPPFTRGVHPTMYRGRVWSMRMFSGFGSPEDTNRRFHYLLKHGESGLSIAFDDPTLYGIDADDPEALGEVGKCGVNVGSLADGRAYVGEAVRRGLDVDEFAPRLSFFFNSHNDFFEEIAKFRAARRLWAEVMRDEFGARNERSRWLRFHTQTAGCSCTAQQPELNIVRTTLQALAGVLGGTQSLHTNSYDEALQLPSEDAVRIALRTQQILASESGVAESVDPFAGSYYVEWLTDTMEEEARKYFDRIDELGGVVPAIERGFFQREIQEASFRYQRAVETGAEKVVGVNAYTVDAAVKVPRLKISEEARRLQSARLRALRARRNRSRHAAALDRLRKVAATEDGNTMPAVLDALRADATLGEIVHAFQDVYGAYRERSTY